MKTITGCLAILLGGIGVLVTLIIIGLVWWGAFTITSQVQKVTTQADQSLAQAEESCSHLKQRLASTAQSVEAVRVSAANAARERPNTPVTKDEVEQIQAKLLPLTEQAVAIQEALSPVAQMLDNAANLAEQSGNKARADRLRSIASNVREAAKQLGSVNDRASTIRRGEPTPTAKDLENLALQTRQSLDLLTTSLSDVKQESESLRKSLPDAQRTLDEWKITGAGIGTGVLFWVGLGQLAIIAWGRRRLADRYAPTSQTSATPK